MIHYFISICFETSDATLKESHRTLFAHNLSEIEVWFREQRKKHPHQKFLSAFAMPWIKDNETFEVLKKRVIERCIYDALATQKREGGAIYNND